MSQVNPTILYIGLIVLAIGAGVGEHFGVVPAGTLAVILGAITGGGIFHAGVAGANSTAQIINAQNGAAQTPPPPASDTKEGVTP